MLLGVPTHRLRITALEGRHSYLRGMTGVGGYRAIDFPLQLGKEL